MMLARGPVMLGPSAALTWTRTLRCIDSVCPCLPKTHACAPLDRQNRGAIPVRDYAHKRLSRAVRRYDDDVLQRDIEMRTL